MYFDAYAEDLITKCNNRPVRFVEEVTGFRFQARLSDIIYAGYEINKLFNTFGVVTIKDVLMQFVPESDLGGISKELLNTGWTCTCYDGMEAYWIDFHIGCVEELGDTTFTLDYMMEACPICGECDGECTREWVEIMGNSYQRSWIRH